MCTMLIFVHMKLTEQNGEASTETVGMGIRLTFEQRAALKAIATKQCNSIGGIVRLAVQQLLENDPEVVRVAAKKTKKQS